MKKINYNAIISSVQELLRIALLAIIPLALEQLTSGAISLKSLGMAGGIAILKALDEWNHKRGNESPLDLKALDELKK